MQEKRDTHTICSIYIYANWEAQPQRDRTAWQL